MLKSTLVEVAGPEEPAAVRGVSSVKKESAVRQTETDSASMKRITQSLERAIAWPWSDDEFSGKLSSVKFITESFQRHMERQFAFEEFGGYMAGVCSRHPELTHEVSHLKRVHVQLRVKVRRLVLHLDQTSPTQFAIFDAICSNLQSLISCFREHNRRENELFIEALFRDTGGEG